MIEITEPLQLEDIATASKVIADATVRFGQGALIGSIASIVALISDDQWQQLMDNSSQPCGNDGCDCHLWTPDVFKGLDIAREAYGENVPR